MKEEGADNDLIERIAQDNAFDLKRDELDSLMDANRFIGRAPEQTEEYVEWVKASILIENNELMDLSSDLTV